MTKLHTLGPYTLLRRLAIGGMAELYLARKSGGLGFEKYYAIKVMLPQHTGDPEHEKVMIDEARLTSQLRHDNIVAVVDLDKDQNRTFMVMEYIRGQDLSVLLQKLREAKGMIALEIAAFVTREICAGLHYVHTRIGADGKPLNLVHRDISPQNVLVGVEGDVKLIDFGVAKARGKGRIETKTGIIKGKLRYMAPEYAVGNLQDARSDIFAAGLILYELITGVPAYDETGIEPSEFLDRIKYARVPHPSQIRQDIPPDLENIIVRALAQHPEKRYQDALEMQQDLSIYLSRVAPQFTRAHCGVYFQSVFEKLGIEPVLPETINADAEEANPPVEARQLERSLEHALDQTGRIQFSDTDVKAAMDTTGKIQVGGHQSGLVLEPTAQLNVLERDPSAPRIVTVSKFTEFFKHTDESKAAATMEIERRPVPKLPIKPVTFQPASQPAGPPILDIEFEPLNAAEITQEELPEVAIEVTDRLDSKAVDALHEKHPSWEDDDEPDAHTNIIRQTTEPMTPLSRRQTQPFVSESKTIPTPATTGTGEHFKPSFSHLPPVAKPQVPAAAPVYSGLQSGLNPIMQPTLQTTPPPAVSQQPQPFPSALPAPFGAQPTPTPAPPPPQTPSTGTTKERASLHLHDGIAQGTHRPFKLRDEDEDPLTKKNVHSQNVKGLIGGMIVLAVLMMIVMFML